MKTTIFLFVGFSCIFFRASAQQKDTTDLLFTGTKINPYLDERDSGAVLTYSGYIDTYFASYSDSVGLAGYEKFPTISPRNNQLGLNIIQFSVKYESTHFRGTGTLFYGDCPLSSWSSYLNLIQEANLGFKIVKKWWFDAGFFRTHIGLESIQPRENMTLSLATTTYFEPYFLSGAKLTWQKSNKFTFQLNAFNSFNQFVETNKNKAVGFSVSYYPNDYFSLSFNSILCDESPTTTPIKQMRSYTNLYGVYKKPKFILGFEVNYGYQENSKLSDLTKPATMFSSILAMKYRFTHKWASYIRGEVFSDPDEILTGPLVNANHQYVGLDILGGTLGFEFKPVPHSYFRVESRVLQTKGNEDIFYYNGKSGNIRLEALVGLGLWF